MKAFEKSLHNRNGNRNGNMMGIEVNHNTISKREIKLLAKVKYNFHENELLILILILKNNPNIIIHRK